jgi:hypothetical protein
MWRQEGELELIVPDPFPNFEVMDTMEAIGDAVGEAAEAIALYYIQSGKKLAINMYVEHGTTAKSPDPVPGPKNWPPKLLGRGRKEPAP